MKSIREQIIEVTEKAKRKAQLKVLVDLYEQMVNQEQAFMASEDDDLVCPTWMVAVNMVLDKIEELKEAEK